MNFLLCFLEKLVYIHVPTLHSICGSCLTKRWAIESLQNILVQAIEGKRVPTLLVNFYSLTFSQHLLLGDSLPRFSISLIFWSAERNYQQSSTDNFFPPPCVELLACYISIFYLLNFLVYYSDINQVGK